MAHGTLRRVLLTSLVSLQLVALTGRVGAQGGSQVTVLTAENPQPVGLVLPRDERTGAAVGANAQGACGLQSGCGNMTYHGGPVQHNQKVFTIFWAGPSASFPANYQALNNQFIQDINNSPFYAIATQYSDGTGNIANSVTYGGTWLDTVNAIPFSTSSTPTYAELLA